jgi:hypothetical protein
MSASLIPVLAAREAASGISAGGVGLSLGGAALLLGIAAALHHRGKSPRIIGWLTFLVGIPLAGLLAGQLTSLGSISLWSIPASLIVTGYVATVWGYDSFRRRGSVGSGGPHRWLHPLYGLILPALLLTLGGSLGNAAHQALNAVNHGVGSVVSRTTGH